MPYDILRYKNIFIFDKAKYQRLLTILVLALIMQVKFVQSLLDTRDYLSILIEHKIPLLVELLQ